MSISFGRLSCLESCTTQCIDQIIFGGIVDQSSCGIHSTAAMPKPCSEIHLKESPRKRLKRTKKSYQVVPLHNAIIINNQIVVRSIIRRKKYLVDIPNDTGDAALHIAAKHDHKEIASMLMLSGANSRLQNSEGRTPLHVALYHRNKNTAAIIAKTDGENVVQDENGDTPLHLAAQYGYTGIVRDLLASGSCRLQNREGCTPLHSALSYNQKSTATVIARKDNGNVVQDKSGNTPLHLAAQNGYAGIVKYLLATRTDDRIQNKDGCTALHVALSHERRKVAAIIINTIPVNNIQNEDGESPFYYAVRRGQTNIVKKLLDAGVNAHLKDRYGYTPLHSALWFMREEIANTIIETAEANEVQNVGGNTPLHLAVERGYFRVSKKLVILGSNALLQTQGLRTPLSIAMQMRNKNIAMVLLQECALRGVAIDWKSLNVKPCDLQYYMEQLSLYESELQHMRRSKLGNSFVSYYDIARAQLHKLAAYLRNQDIREVLLKDKKIYEFTNYAPLIAFKLVKADRRKSMSDQCLDCFSALTGKLPMLPVTCIDNILIYLNVPDMKNVVKACDLKLKP